MSVTQQILVLDQNVDTFEIVRDQIAAILVVESAGQQQLAEDAAPPLNPKDFALQVFSESTNPWHQWIDSPGQGTFEAAPIVNVWFDSDTVDGRASDPISHQKVRAFYNVDVYGYGVSAGTAEGHDPGDVRAALEAQRGMRLVRRILMHGQYTYLQLPGLVSHRMHESRQMFQPLIDQRPVQNVQAGRFRLAVDFLETSGERDPVDLEIINATVRDPETGQVVLTATYDFTV